MSTRPALPALTASDLAFASRDAEDRDPYRGVVERLPGGGWAYAFIEQAVRVETRYLRRDFRQLHAEVEVRCEWAGAQQRRSVLSCADLNLSSQQARRSLIKLCAQIVEDYGYEPEPAVLEGVA